MYITVIGATDSGLLEGQLRGAGALTGLFPAHHVQEVRLRHGVLPPVMLVAAMQQQQQQPQQCQQEPQFPQQTQQHQRVVGRREHQMSAKHFATAPRLKKT